MTKNLEDLLTSTLTERADEIRDGDALDANYATGILEQGRVVQRRRRIGTALGATSLVTALAIGGAYAVQRNAGTDPGVLAPSPSATTAGPTPTQQPTEDVSNQTTPPRYTDLPTGAPIRVLPRAQATFVQARVSPAPAGVRPDVSSVSVVVASGSGEKIVPLPDRFGFARVYETNSGAVVVAYTKANRDRPVDPQAEIFYIDAAGALTPVDVGALGVPVVSPDGSQYAYVKTPDPNVPSERQLVVRVAQTGTVQVTAGLSPFSNADRLVPTAWTAQGIIVRGELESGANWIVGIVENGKTSVTELDAEVTWAAPLGTTTLQGVTKGDKYCLQIVHKLGDKGEDIMCSAGGFSVAGLDHARVLVEVYEKRGYGSPRRYVTLSSSGDVQDVRVPKGTDAKRGVGTVTAAEGADTVIVATNDDLATPQWARWNTRTGTLEWAPLPNGAAAVFAWR